MRVLLSWLNEFGPFANPHDAAAIDALAADLTALGLAVEDVVAVGGSVAGVVSARVIRVEQHPDAAKVRRVWVDAGDGAERHVWCGASNMGAGDVVPLATLGTTMPNGMTIERRGILGIDSEGMLCSAAELGINDDHSGILLLPADSALGVPYGEVLGLDHDVVFDLDLTRNRPDCWSVEGIARDLAAWRKVPFAARAPMIAERGVARTIPVEVLTDGCGRFTATVMSGVVVGASPEWMIRRLEAVGMRSINNVVDVSNYVMLDIGQPNHAYDFDKVANGFRIRNAREGEVLVTLDEAERTCSPDDVLICDGADVPVGLGGVMGGLDSEIAASTTTVALEVAWFPAIGVMRTATRHGLRSEASARYERGVDPTLAERAVLRFAELLSITCPDLVVHEGTTDERSAGMPPVDRSTSLRASEVTRILGIELSATEIRQLLDPIGFSAAENGDSLSVTLPNWRPDSTTEIDVIEEVARHYGYDRLGRSVPKSTVHGHLTPLQLRRRLLRNVLVGLGLSEAMPNPIVAPDVMQRAGVEGAQLRILNPLVAEESALRISLRPGLLSAISNNEHHRRFGVSLFEIGHVYPPSGDGLPNEFEALCVVLAGREAPDALAIWREIAEALDVGAMVDQSSVPSGLHLTRSGVLRAGRDVIGAVGEIAPEVLDEFDVTERVAVLELRLDSVLGVVKAPPTYRPVSKYPSSDLDLAFVVADDVAADRVERAIRQGAATLLVGLELFDVYRGSGVSDGQRSLAWRLRLQAPDRNLTDADVAEVRMRVEDAVAKFGGELRSSTAR